MRKLIALLVLFLSIATSVSAHGDGECIRRILARGSKRFIRVEVWVTPHAEHRQIDVLVSPGAPLTEDEPPPPDWDGHSTRSLDGEKSKSLHLFEFTGPPSGRYEVTVAISGGGKQIIQRTNVFTSF